MASISSLIYRSPRYADAVWDSVHEFTPELHDGSARFFFVANDPTDEVLRHLTERKYPFVVQRNKTLSEDELRAIGIAPPEYMHRVYRGWNRALDESDDLLVMVASDCMFSPNWFINLVRRVDAKTVVSSKLVERRHPKHGVFPMAIERDFGSNPGNFQKDAFVEFAKDKATTTTHPGGAYGPYAMQKPTIRYPEGNPLNGYGDRDFFSRLAAQGIKHITAEDSIVYHFKEGEMEEGAA